MSAVRPQPIDLPRCLHCGSATLGGARFCCAGCEAVFRFLEDEGLARYYELRGPEGVPAVDAGDEAASRSDRKWLEPLSASLAAHQGLCRVELDVQGLHCSACVWLVEEIFRREPAGAGVVVNPAVGRATLTVEPAFDLDAFVRRIEALGYRLGPPVKEGARAPSDLLWRMGVCVAVAMNAMIFGVAVYAGLASGPVHDLFQALGFGLACVSVAVGGPVFFRSAARALRAGVLHLDLPIALGILLAFATSAASYVARGGATSFFDTLTVFVALMLVGRFLQERIVGRNRAEILASAGAEHIYTRRVEGGATVLVPCTAIAAGDRLVVARADLVPVPAVAEADASFSLDWINGESRPRRFEAGAVVPAGAFSCHEAPLVMRAATSFDAGALAGLLRQSRPDLARDAARATPFWRRLAKTYVALVLALAAASFAGLTIVTGDVQRALGVVTALLIVTCPCAFGIAVPLAYELAQAGLRRAGLFVRSPGFLDRALAVRGVVFDKTGTLTTGALGLANPQALDALEGPELDALRDLVSHSTHPKSQALSRALLSRSGTVDLGAPVIERPGDGLELVRGGRVYRLGRGDGASFGEGGTADAVFSVDGAPRASFVTSEILRRDAADEVHALSALGYRTWMLSGDAAPRVAAVAAACGVSPDRAFAEQTPEGKADGVRRIEADGPVLFLGDGINDAPAAAAATCSGTPAIDRPFMAARTDFYVVSPGLHPVRLALVVARRVARVVRVNLAIAVAYNVLTVGIAIAGRMTPLACAVLMPLASVTTVLATTFALSKRSAVWRS